MTRREQDRRLPAVVATLASSCRPARARRPPRRRARRQHGTDHGGLAAPRRRRHGRRHQAACGTVNIAVNPWVGYEADAAVVGYMLKNALGCTVVKKNIDEQTSLAGLPDRRGRRDPGELGPRGPAAKYITRPEGRRGPRAPTATRASSAGTSRSSSPTRTRTSYRQDWTRRSSTSTPTSSRPRSRAARASSSTATRRTSPTTQAMVKGLGLNYTVVYSGSEAASDQAIQSAIDAQKPILAYYYKPNWFSSKVDLVHLELPAWTHGLRHDGSEHHQVRLPAVPPEQGRLDEVRQLRQPGVQRHQELHLDQRRPERGRGLHHRPVDVRRRRSQEVARRQPRQVAGLAAVAGRLS